MTNRFVELLSTEVWYCQCCAFFSVGRWTGYSDLLHQATWVKGLARVCSGWMKSPTHLRRCRVSLVTLLGHLHGTGSSTASRLNKIKQDRNVDQCRHRCTDNVSRGFADAQLHPIATYPHHPQPYLSDYDLIWFNMKLFQRIPLPAFAGVTVCNKNGQPLKHRLQTVYSFSYYTIKCNKLINMFFLQSLKPKTSKTPFALVTDRKTIHRLKLFCWLTSSQDKILKDNDEFISTMAVLLQPYCCLAPWHVKGLCIVNWSCVAFINLVVYWVIFELLLSSSRMNEYITVLYCFCNCHNAGRKSKDFHMLSLRKSRWRCTRKDGGRPNTWPPKPFLGTIWRLGAHADRWLYLSNVLLDLAAEPVEDDAFLWSRSGKGDVVFRGWNFWHTDRGGKRKSRKAWNVIYILALRW